MRVVEQFRQQPGVWNPASDGSTEKRQDWKYFSLQVLVLDCLGKACSA